MLQYLTIIIILYSLYIVYLYYMKNTLLMFAFLVTVFGLIGCSTNAPAPTADTPPVPQEDMDMDEDMMWEDDDMMWDEELGEADVVIDITGENFSYSQDTIEVTEWDVVTINFTSDQGFHDWVVDEFDAATEQVETWGTTSVTFVASQAGEFEFYCSVGAHRANWMVGTLVVNAAE